MNIIQQRIEELGSQLLVEGITEEVKAKIFAQAEELQRFLDISAKQTIPSPAKHTVRIQREKKQGRKEYAESDVIKNSRELAVAIQYKQYIGNVAQEAQRVEFLLLGKVKDPRNGATGFLTALKSCQDVADLKRGSIYAFRNSTLNTMEVLGA